MAKRKGRRKRFKFPPGTTHKMTENPHGWQTWVFWEPPKPEIDKTRRKPHH